MSSPLHHSSSSPHFSSSSWPTISTPSAGAIDDITVDSDHLRGLTYSDASGSLNGRTFTPIVSQASNPKPDALAGASGDGEEMEVYLDPSTPSSPSAPSSPVGQRVTIEGDDGDDKTETNVKEKDNKNLLTAGITSGVGVAALGAGVVVTLIACAFPPAIIIAAPIGLTLIAAGGVALPVGVHQLTGEKLAQNKERSDYMCRFDKQTPSYNQARKAGALNEEMPLNVLEEKGGMQPSDRLQRLDKSYGDLKDRRAVDEEILDTCPFPEILRSCREGTLTLAEIKQLIEGQSIDKDRLKDALEAQLIDKARAANGGAEPSQGTKDTIHDKVQTISDADADDLVTYWKEFMILVAARNQKAGPVGEEFFVEQNAPPAAGAPAA